MEERDNWEFIYKNGCSEFPMGYYIHIPSGKKYCFTRGIKDKVSLKDEAYIYDRWWLDNS